MPYLNSSDTITATRRPIPPAEPEPALDNRSSYVAWGLAWIAGYGSYAVSKGTDPLLSLPPALPGVLLAVGLVAALAVTVRAIVRGQRGASPAAALSGSLLGGAWVVGFGALFLLITTLGGHLDDHRVETVLWPVGSAFVVGLLYLAGGAVHRDLVQYALGGWLALSGTAGLFLGLPAMYAVLAVAGGGAYLTAAVVEHRRRF